MNKIAIMTDSSAILTAAEAKFYGIYLLPLNIVLKNNEIIADTKDNYVKYNIWAGIEDGTVTGTSQNNAEEMKKVFDQALLEHDHVLYIPVAANLSSQYESAKLVASQAPYKDRITVLKQYATACLLKFISIKAVQKVQSGHSLSQIIDFVYESANESYTAMTPGNLERMERSGRVNKILLKVLNFSRTKLLIRWGKKSKLVHFSLTIRNVVNGFAKQYHAFVKNKTSEYVLFLYGNKKQFPLNSVKAMQRLSQLNIKYHFVDFCGIFSVHAGVGLLGFYIMPLSLIPTNLMNPTTN